MPPLGRSLGKRNCRLKGVTAALTLPKMAHAALINVFRQFRRKQPFATLRTFSYHTCASSLWDDAVGMKGHGTFLTRLPAFYVRHFFIPVPGNFVLKNSETIQVELE
jgi:hypothetical protein